MTTTSILTLSKLASTAVASYGIGLQKDDLKGSLTEGYAGLSQTNYRSEL